MLNNPYFNSAILNNSNNSNNQSQTNQNNLLNSLGQAYNGFPFQLNNAMQNGTFANPSLHGLNSAASALSNQTTPSHHDIWHEGAANIHSTLMSNLSNAPGFLQASATTTSTGVNLNDEHQVYEYLHQLLEEKEKLKELFNEPFNIMLPISAKLLDEGNLFI